MILESVLHHLLVAGGLRESRIENLLFDHRVQGELRADDLRHLEFGRAVVPRGLEFPEKFFDALVIGFEQGNGILGHDESPVRRTTSP